MKLLDRFSEYLPAALTVGACALLVVALWAGWIVPGDAFVRVR